MELGYVCHAPGPADRLEDYGATVVRIDFTQGLDNEADIRPWLQRVQSHGLTLYATVSTEESTVDALTWNAVRVWQLCREEGVTLLGIGLENEPNTGPAHAWEYDPHAYGVACVRAFDALRADGYVGPVYIGAVSNLTRDRFNLAGPVRKLFSYGYGGLTYLHEMACWDERAFGCQVHLYEDITSAIHADLRSVIGPERPLVVGEIGSKDNEQPATAAAEWIVRNLSAWRDLNDSWLVAVIVYVWTENANTDNPDNLGHACMQAHADGTVTEKPQGVAILDWATEPQGE